MRAESSLIVKLPVHFQPSSIPKDVTRVNVNDALAPTDTLPKITTHFTQSQLAIALSIQKSKPVGISMNDYCQQLQKHVRRGQPASSTQSRYVDTTEFWKDQYTRIHLEKKMLEDKVQLLENDKQLCQAMHFNDDTQDKECSLHNLLISILNKEQSSSPVSRKRPTSPQPTEESHSNSHQDDSIAKELTLKLSSFFLRVGKQRGLLDKMTKETNTLDHINSLAKQTFQVLGIIDLVLTECCLPLRLLKTNSGDRQTLVLFQQVMNQLAFAFLSCFSALDELCRTIPGRSQKSGLIHQMVLFFSKSLSLLHTMSALQAEDSRTQGRSAQAKRVRTEEVEYAASRYIAATLVTICDEIEWKIGQASHSDLLEGFLFSILEHTGRLVSEAVFSEHVAASDSVGNITKDLPSDDLGLIKFESRYIVQVLHAALGGRSKKELVSQVLAAGKIDFQGPEISSRLSGQMLSKAKLLLQSTLIESAVGGNDLETLRMPTPPAEDAEILTGDVGIAERYGSEWLIETVWALIGWDMVA